METVDALFLFANFFFLFVSLVFLLSFLENRARAKQNPSPKRFPSVTVIIPAFNEEKNVARAVRGVKALDYPGRVDVLVVDDGSTDATARKAREAGARVLRKKQGGKADALNAGIRAAEGELVACLDADSHPQTGALTKMVGYLEKPGVGAVTGSVKIAEPHSVIQWVQFVEYIGMNYLRKSAAFLNGVMCTPGPFSVYKRRALQDIGGFEKGNITEDTEIALRLQSRGYGIENCLNAVAYSIAPYSLRDLMRQRVRWYRGALINGRKYSFMFFNQRFGNLGWFVLPTNFIAVAFALFVVAKLAGILFAGGTGLLFLALSSLQNAPSAMGATLLERANPLYFFSVDVVIAFLYLSLIVCVFYLSFKAGDEEFRVTHLPFYMFYLFAYSFVVTSAWFVGIANELTGRKAKW